jgi:hypothetical protein
MSDMKYCILQLMQFIQYCYVSLFSTIITNEFIGEEFCLSPNSLDDYEAMGFDATQLTQDEEQSLFTLKTDMPIPMLLYGNSFHWAKYGHHILPSSLDLASNNKAGLHCTFWNSLIEFLRTDLDGNLSCNLNPQISFKLDHYLSRLFERLSETGSKSETFDQHLLNEKCKDYFIKEIVDIALDATQIPLSIFTKLLHQRFEKHSMLESTLEILQQFYIQMETEPDDFPFFPGDLSTYMLKCIRCGQHNTLHGSIGETLFHAPAAIVYHWNMIQPHDKQNDRELMLMPLVFTSYENYLQSLKSFQEGLKWMEDLKICQKPTKYGQVMFCEAVEVDMANSKDSSFNNTITSTLSLITVLFADLFEAITIHMDFCGRKMDPKRSIPLLNKTNTFNGYDFTIIIFEDEVNALQKESLMLFEAYCIFGYREFYKKMLCILMEVNKTMYETNEGVPDNFWRFSF